MTAAQGPWFSRDIGHRHRYHDDVALIELPVIDQLCVPGTGAVRISVLATVADIAAGSLIQPEVEPYVPLTVDLDVRRAELRPVGDLVGTSRFVKHGQNIAVLEVSFAAERAPDEPVAVSYVRFIRSPKPSDFFKRGFPDFSGVDGAMLRPFAEQLGAQVVAPGEVVIDRWSYVLQPTGTIQGGAITLVAELAAESATAMPVVDIDVHFLSPVTVGPARAVAHRLWEGTARVDLRDEGKDNRLVATAMARCAPPA